MVMREMPGNRETHILNRGLYSDRKEVVTAVTPGFLPSSNEKGPPEPPVAGPLADFPESPPARPGHG